MKSTNIRNDAVEALLGFFSEIGGIPPDNRGEEYGKRNELIRARFSAYGIVDIILALEEERKVRSNPRLLKLLGLAYFQSGNIQQAISILVKALRNTEEDPVAIYEVLAQCHILLDDIPTAIKICNYSYRMSVQNIVDTYGLDAAWCWAKSTQLHGCPVFGRVNENEFTESYLKIAALLQTNRITALEAQSLYSALREGKRLNLPGGSPVTFHQSYSATPLSFKTVTASTRNTVFTTMFYELLLRGYFSFTFADVGQIGQLSETGVANINPLMTPHDKALVDALNQLIDTVPSPNPDMTESEMAAALEKLSVAREVFVSLAPGADNIFNETIVKNPSHFLWNWPEWLIIADTEKEFGWQFHSKRPVYDEETNILMAVEYRFLE
jgi:tetratricopeptide (TPR) repeat protein